ncbi:MAG: hypothetical protein HOV80_17255 [Polyangiaceae bacterium]|nr:hypothetical protein [Polyangiaceae bacterium]
MDDEGGPDRRCRSCSRPVASSELYFRFALALEGELDVLDTGRPGDDDPHEVIAAMRDVSAEEAEDGVHWETAGILCGSCRRELIAWLGAAPFQN